MDEFVKHLDNHESSPAIARQRQCILQHWQDLDAAGADTDDSTDGADSQADDDPEDLHSDVRDHFDEAETIHSFGKDC